MEEKINKYINDITNISNSNELDADSIKNSTWKKGHIVSVII